MNGRYVLTSSCLSTGSMHLTRTLRQSLMGQDSARFVDEEGEVYECKVNWAAGCVEGLGPYYAKRRLAVNEVIVLGFEGGRVNLQAMNQRPPKPAPRVQPPQEAPAAEPHKALERRVRISPSPKEHLSQHAGMSVETPSFAADMERLGFHREHGGPPWLFTATLGRRAYSIALARMGEVDPTDLLALRRKGIVQYAGIVTGESLRREVEAELLGSNPPGLFEPSLCIVTPEALLKLAKLRAAFPVGALDIERLVRGGRLDLNALGGLEAELDGVLGERATFSAVLMVLSELPPQRVFLLADLLPSAAELGLEPENVRQVLDVLAGPPFMLLKRLSPGEFLLRAPISQALEELSQYARLVLERVAVTSD